LDLCAIVECLKTVGNIVLEFDEELDEFQNYKVL
jgi:hypothetical protein